MRRGSKPAKSKTESKLSVSRKSPRSDGATVRDLEQSLAEALEGKADALREKAEVQEQQAATAEILRGISASPTDPQPGLDAILKRAATLCEAQLAHLWLYEDGEQFRLGAGYGSRPDHLEWLQQGLHRFGQPFFRESGPWRVGQVLDVRDTEPYRRGEPLWIRTADHEGMRTLLGVPLVQAGRLVGSIAVYPREVQPFTDQQTALVQTFADQAVIAIENVRLFNETKEALEQQTATSEILRVISRSPTDLQPVFDSIAASALRLCDAKLCTTFRFDGELIHLVGSRHVSEEGADAYRDAYPSRPGRQGGTHRAILTRAIVHIPDIREDAEYELRALARANDYGCVLSVPMLRDGHPVGAITVGREAARPFTNGQIELLKTFADQAVIAIENVRLFKELQAKNADLTEALDQQTATAEILRVISQSQTDVHPVFDTIIRSAVRLLTGFSGVI